MADDARGVAVSAELDHIAVRSLRPDHYMIGTHNDPPNVRDAEATSIPSTAPERSRISGFHQLHRGFRVRLHDHHTAQDAHLRRGDPDALFFYAASQSLSSISVRRRASKSPQRVISLSKARRRASLRFRIAIRSVPFPHKLISEYTVIFRFGRSRANSNSTPVKKCARANPDSAASAYSGTDC